MTCPTPWKMAYASHDAARMARRLRSRGQRSRIYECHCGYWHMTTGMVKAW